MNLSIGETCVWEHVPTKVVPSCCLPHERGKPQHGSVAVVTGPYQPLLESALLRGMPLKVPELKQIMQMTHVPMPKTGSGKNKRVIKYDLAVALLSFHFPAMTPEELVKLAQSITGQQDSNERIPEGTAPAHLELIAALDPDEKQHFKPLIKEAMDHLETAVKRETNRLKLKRKFEESCELQEKDKAAEASGSSAAKAKAKAAASPSSGSAGVRLQPDSRTRAPPEFTRLLPDVDGLYFHNEAKNRRFSVEFKKISPHFQRTKSCKYPVGASLEQRVTALDVVFAYVEFAYHSEFKTDPNYRADYRAPSSQRLQEALVEMEARIG